MAREVSTLLWGQFLISVLAAGVHGVLGAGRGHRPLSLGSGRDHLVLQALHQSHAPSGKSSSSHPALPGHHNHEEPGTSRAAAFCPHGWTRWGGNCYQYFGDTVMQPAAETLCRGKGGYMVEIESDAENKFVADLIMRSQGWVSFYRNTWIGVSDRAVEGQFRLLSRPNAPLAYSHWGLDDPNDAFGGEDCVIIADPANGLWFDAKCIIPAYYVCEIGSSNPVSTPKPTAVTTMTMTTMETKTKSHKYSRITPETTTAAAAATVPANCNTTLCIITSGEWTNNMVG